MTAEQAPSWEPLAGLAQHIWVSILLTTEEPLLKLTESFCHYPGRMAALPLLGSWMQPCQRLPHHQAQRQPELPMHPRQPDSLPPPTLAPSSPSALMGFQAIVQQKHHTQQQPLYRLLPPPLRGPVALTALGWATPAQPMSTPTLWSQRSGLTAERVTPPSSTRCQMSLGPQKQLP